MTPTQRILLAGLVLLVTTSARPAEPGKTNLDGDPLPEGAVARMGTVRFRHALPVATLSYSTDGKTLVSVGWDGVRVWDTATGKPRLLITASEPYYLPNATLSPDGRILAVSLANVDMASFKGIVEIRLWDLDTGMPLPGRTIRMEFSREMGHHLAAHPITFSPDGKSILAGGWRVVRIFDAVTGNRMRELGVQRTEVRSLAFSTDGKTLAVAGIDGEDLSGQSSIIHILDAATGKEHRTIPGLGYWRGGMAFSRDGKRVAAVWTELGNKLISRVALWDVATGKKVRTVEVATVLRALAFSPDGTRLGSFDTRNARFWETATGKEQIGFEHSGMATCMAFSPDGKKLAWGDDHAIRFRDAATFQELSIGRGHRGAVTSMAFSADGKSLTSAGDSSAWRWETGTGRELFNVRPHPRGHEHPRRTPYFADLLPGPVPIVSAAISPDGRTLISGCAADATIRLWEVATGAKLHEVKERWSEFMAETDGQPMDDPRVGWRQLGPFAFSADGQAVAWARTYAVVHVGEYVVTIWDVAKREKRLTLPQHSSPGMVSALAFSPDNRTLAVGYCSPIRDDGAVRLYDALTGQDRWIWTDSLLPGNDRNIYCVTFSPDGKLVLSGNGQGVVQLHDSATGKIRRRLEAHKRPVTALALSRDGQRIASADSKGTLRLWDVASGKELLNRTGASGVSSLQFSADGKLLASGMWDTTVLVWNLADVEKKE